MTAEHAKMLAEFTNIGETGPKADDDALQSLRRAREAEVSEAEAVGAGEIGAEVIEYLGELDASAEDAVENAIAVAEAYEDRPDEPTARTVAMQKYKARQPKRGAPRPAACKEFSVDETDSMALDKVRTAYRLKRVGATLADLENFHPGFWALPLETLDEVARLPSRKLVLARFLYRRENEIKQQEKRKAKIAAKGWPADYYDKQPAERRTINNRCSQQRSRERRAGTA